MKHRLPEFGPLYGPRENKPKQATRGSIKFRPPASSRSIVDLSQPVEDSGMSVDADKLAKELNVLAEDEREANRLVGGRDWYSRRR